VIKEIRGGKYFSEDLDETSKAKVDYLTKMMIKFNIFELRYLSYRVKEKLRRGVGINPLKLNIDWPSIKPNGTFSLITCDS